VEVIINPDLDLVAVGLKDMPTQRFTGTRLPQYYPLRPKPKFGQRRLLLYTENH
jgi:hypothetical protein